MNQFEIYSQLLISLEIQMKRILSLSHPAQMAKECFIRQFPYDITLYGIEPIRSKWGQNLEKLLKETPIEEIKGWSEKSKTIWAKRIFIGSQVKTLS